MLHLKPVKAKARAPKTRQIGRYAKELEAAKAGKLPKAPDFSAPTRLRYRAKLKMITDLVKAGDVKGLKALDIQPVHSANIAMLRYRDHALIALQAKG